MLNLARQEIEPGHGVCFIDPHGDAARALLDAIPAWRVDDVIYLDPSDTGQPIGFNPLECDDPARRALVADGVVSAFKHVFADSWGPRLEHFLLNACRTLLEQDQATLIPSSPPRTADSTAKNFAERNRVNGRLSRTRPLWQMYHHYSAAGV